MKVTLSQTATNNSTLWVGEVLNADWDNYKAEFIFSGNKNLAALTGVVSNMLDRHELTIEIEGGGPGLLVWRGHVSNTKFQMADAEHVECSLMLLLEDWFGIFPKSAIPEQVDAMKRTRLYPPLPPF